MSGPHQLVDFATKDADSLIAQMAQTLAPVYNTGTPMINDCLCVLSPEHYDTLVAGGITSKKMFSEKLWSV